MASTMIRNRVPMPVVRKSGGWVDLDSMRKYCRAIDDQVVQVSDATGSLK